MSGEDSNDSSVSNSETEQSKQSMFVSLLKGKQALFSKSQLPSAKGKKEDILKNLKQEYELKFGKEISEKQLMKKINNMKTEVRKKADINKTGNKKIRLKAWQNELLILMDSESNPTFVQVKGMYYTIIILTKLYLSTIFM